MKRRSEVTPEAEAQTGVVTRRELSASEQDALFERLLADFELWLRQADLADVTRDKYTRNVRVFYQHCRGIDRPLGRVRAKDVASWRDDLRKTLAARTVNQRLCSVRAFYVYLEEKGILRRNPAARVRCASRRAERHHRRQALTDDEARALLCACDGSISGCRDNALLHLALYTGLRGIELHRLDIEDLYVTDGRVVAEVWGKGSMEPDRVVVLPAPAEAALRSWLAVHPRQGGPLFVSLTRSRSARLSQRAIRALVKSRMAACGIASQVKSAHSLRHTLITNLIRQGAAPGQVMAVTGHRRFDTVLAYYHQTGRLDNPPEDLVDYG